MAGRLDGYFDGRPVSIIAHDREVTIITSRISTLLRMRSNWKAIAPALARVFQRADIKLMTKIGSFGNVEILPNPNYLIRLLLPRE